VSRRLAALDIGSNTLQLLVAEPVDGALREVLHEEAMPRIGKAVQETGRVGEVKLAEVVREVQRLAALAREQGAEVLLVAATEAVRRASDGELVLAAVSEAAGARCRLISPEAEARLSFRGAVAAHRGPGLSLVADIGGGSTECVLGEDGQIEALASVPVGSGSATERWLRSDPPSNDEREACGAGVRKALSAAPQGDPQRGIVTGGTATTLPALLGRPRGSEGGTLRRADLDQCRQILAREPSAEVARQYGIELARARVLAGGVEIIDAVRERYGLGGVAVSHQGLRDGMILAYLEMGDGWTSG
jgi:exopolyphosphatase/guanosine-5'-triphosphate,3'-diphosphate pyrophosphatase